MRPTPHWPTGRRHVDRPLSYRELQVGAEIANGFSNAETGELLGVRSKTVKSHLQRISDALGFGGRVSIAVHLVRSGEILYCGGCSRFVAPKYRPMPNAARAGHCPHCDKMMMLTVTA